MTSLAIYIILFLFGVLIGNFTTSVFYRMPRNIMVCGFDKKSTKPPFCSKCSHILRFYEYLPILSWFSTLGKCNYCHAPITKAYMALEILIGLMAMILYYLLWQNLDCFFIYFCFAALVFLNIFIYLEHRFVSIRVTLCIIVLGMIYRTLIDQEIFGWVVELSLASILSMWIMRGSLDDENLSNQNKSLVHLILPISLWCYFSHGVVLLGIGSSLCYFFPKIVANKLFYPICLSGLFFVSLGLLVLRY